MVKGYKIEFNMHFINFFRTSGFFSVFILTAFASEKESYLNLNNSQNYLEASCPEENFVPSFDPEKIYNYYLNSDLTLCVNTSNHSINISSDIKLKVRDRAKPCTIELIVSSWNGTFNPPNIGKGDERNHDIQGESFNSNMSTIFTYYNGKVHNIWLPDDDPWKNNIRKGIVSLFQTNSEYLKNNISHEVFEEDIFGRLNTIYKLQDGLVSKVKQRNQGGRNLGGFEIFAEPILSANNDGISNFTDTELVKCMQNLTETGLMNSIECSESQTNFQSEFPTWFYATTTMKLIGIDERPKEDHPDQAELILSNLQLDYDIVQTTTSKMLIDRFSNEVIRSEFCSHVRNSFDLESNTFLKFFEVMKKMVQRLPKEVLTKEFDYVREKLECVSDDESRSLQTNIFLNIIAMTPPTDDTLDFMIDQILKGRVPKEMFNTWLYKVPFMPFPHLRVLKGMKKLIDAEYSFNRPKEKVVFLLRCSTLVSVYAKRFNIMPEEIHGHPDLKDLIALVIKHTINDEKIDKLTKIEILNNMGNLVDDECNNLAVDDSEKLRCFTSCGNNKSDEYLKTLFMNKRAETDGRKIAFVKLWKCSNTDVRRKILEEFVENQLDKDQPDLADFVKCHVEVMGDSKFKNEISWTLNKKNECNNHLFINRNQYVERNFQMNLETYVIIGSLKIPRLIRISWDGENLQNARLYRFFVLEIFLTDEMDAFIALKHFGNTILTEKVSLNPLNYLNKEMDTKSILLSLGPKLLNLLRTLSEDSKVDFFYLHSIVDESVFYPTLSGLPIKTQFETSIKLTFNLLKKGLEGLIFGRNYFDSQVFLAPKITGRAVRTSSIVVANNEVAGFQLNKVFNGYFRVNLEIRKPKGSPWKFSATFGNSSSMGQNLNAFKFELIRNLQNFQFLERSSQQFPGDSLGNGMNEIEIKIREYTFPTLLEKQNNCKTILQSEGNIYNSTYLCTFQNWFFIVSSDMDEDKSIEFEMKLYPENRDKDNLVKFNVSYSSSENNGGGHEFSVGFESPFKHLYMLRNFTWSLKNHEDHKWVSLWITLGNNNQVGGEVFIVQDVWNVTEESPAWTCDRKGRGGLLCRWPFCILCGEQYKIGFKAKTPFPGWEEIVFVQGNITQDFLMENKVDMILESRGIHKFLDTKVQLRFERTDSKTIFPERDPKSSSLKEMPCKNRTYSTQFQVDNGFLGKFSVVESLSLLYMDDNDSEDESAVGAISLEYGRRKPYHTFHARMSRTEWLKIKSDITSENVDESLTEFKVDSSQLPCIGFTFLIRDKTKTIQRDDCQCQETWSLDRVYTLVPTEWPEHTLNIDWSSHVKSLEIKDMEFNTTLVARLLSMESGQYLSCKLNVLRSKNNLEQLDLGLYIGTFLNSDLWYFKNDTSVFLKGQLRTLNISQDSSHYAQKVTEDKWNYQGEHFMPGWGSYKASGIFLPSSNAPTHFRGFDVFITKDAFVNPLKISYYEIEEAESLKYRLNAETESIKHLESTVEITKTLNKVPIKANIKLKDVFETEFEGRSGQLKFLTKYVPKSFKTNGTINFRFIPEDPLISADVDWVDENNPNKAKGNFYTETSVVLEKKQQFKSKWNFSSGEDSSELLMILNFYLESKPNPVVYLYFTEQKGQRYGVDLSTHWFVRQNNVQDDFDQGHDYSAGLLLTCERPQLEPFFTNISYDIFRYHMNATSDLEPADIISGQNIHNAKLHFFHKSNPFYAFPYINTDFIITLGLDNFYNYSQSENQQDEYVNLGILIKANGEQSIPETKVSSVTHIVRDFPQNTANLRTLTHQISFENVHFKTGFIGKYNASLELERDPDMIMNEEININDTLQTDILSLDSTDEQIEKNTSSLLYLFSTFFPNGSIFQHNSWLTYNAYAVWDSSPNNSFNFEGSHNFTRVVESCLNFEFSGSHLLLWNGEELLMTWVDQLSRSQLNNSDEINLFSSKLVDFKIRLDDNNTTLTPPLILPNFKANASILHPGHWTEITSEFGYTKNSTFLNQESFNFLLAFKSDDKIYRNGEVNLVHQSICSEHASRITNFLIILNDQRASINNVFEQSEASYGTSLKHRFEFLARDPNEIHAKFDFGSYTTVGEIEDLAEFIHHDFYLTFVSHMSRGTIESFKTFNGSLTATSPVHLPQLVSIQFDMNLSAGGNYVSDEPKRFGRMILVRGSIPEFNCLSELKGWDYLSSQEEFPLSLEIVDKFIRNKVYCNQFGVKGNEGCPDCKVSDGGFLMESKTMYSNIDSDSTADVPVRNTYKSLEAAWTGENCHSAYIEVEREKSLEISKNMSKICNSVLKKMDPCWFQPQKCSQESWEIKQNLTFRQKIIPAIVVSVNSAFICLVFFSTFF